MWSRYDGYGERWVPAPMSWFFAGLMAVVGMLCGHVEGCSMARGVQAVSAVASPPDREVHGGLKRFEFSDAICFCASPPAAENGGDFCYAGSTVSCIAKTKNNGETR